MDPRLREDDEKKMEPACASMSRKDGNRVSEYGEKKMDPRLREDDAEKAPVIPAQSLPST